MATARERPQRGAVRHADAGVTATYDIITIGGGLAGASLATVMAERGARVLV